GPRWSRRRLLDVCARTAETMGYAHSHGVIHRDLKPENIMIGEFGQVMIMDWGLARRVVSEPPPDSGSSAGQPSSGAHGQDASLTQQGDILGTPAYMSPEQARGNVHLHGPTSDVYSLGAILFHILAGHPPFADLGPMAWRRILTGDPPRLSEVAKPDVPGELLAICERAMAFEPGKRFSDGAEMAVEINAFLDGAHRRERALAELGTATLLKPEIDRRKALAGTLRAKAREVLSKARPADPVEVKLPGWELEDEAEKNDHEAELLETNWLQGVLGALSIDPELPEAHSGLADHYKEKLLDAEQQRRTGEAARFEVLLRAHDRGQHAAILSGKGALSLHTDPEGAEVTLYRYSVVKRRLVPELVKELGRTPLSEVSLDKGSYLVRIQAPGRIDVSYPVLIERGRCWDGCPPGSDEPCPVALPELSEVGDDEVYVPAGPAWTGGDPDAVDNLPRRLVWMSGFFVGRYPVTNGEYLAFLNDLVATGREEEAWAACPKSDRGVGGGAGGELSYARGPLGAFLCKEQDSGMPWSVRSPVVLVSWRSAMAYAKWRSARSGRRYRLLNELEREKATRGVDGRPFPWGSSFDATWARSLMSQTGAPSPVEVTEYATDESPYGLRGGAGNVRDLCGNRWTLDGPRVEQGRLLVEEEPAESSVEYVSSRGGAWQSVEHLCRAAGRYAISPDQWRTTLGFRVGRSLGEPVRR
ncbi:MAG: bifunctional serine/threonine-protein kinase/formylglycine-generating enzyme family protein, partial [Polyangiaceae bacterium]